MSKCQCWKSYVCLACERGERERERASKPPAPPRISKPRPVAQCGTRAGYNKHIRLGEVTCAECKQAQLDAVKEWKRRKAS